MKLAAVYGERESSFYLRDYFITFSPSQSDHTLVLERAGRVCGCGCVGVFVYAENIHYALDPAGSRVYRGDESGEVASDNSKAPHEFYAFNE